MVDRSSAIESNYNRGNHPDNKQPQLQLCEIKNLKLVQVAAWPETLDKVGSIISEYLNLTKYPLPNKVVTNKSIAMMRIEPLKWWIIESNIPDLSINDGTTLDLSHSFTNLEISGSSATIFLNRHIPIDLRENSFPINTIVSSAIHHVSIKLWRSKTGFHLFIPRGFALSIWELFLATSNQFNFRIK